MLTLQDCIAMSGLTAEEVAAIADHEHLSDVVATEMGSYLVALPQGRMAIKTIIRDDIEAAQRRGDFRRSARLKLVLQNFVAHGGAGGIGNGD